MLKKTIKYTDYNDVERTEDFYFNLSKAEIMEMELTTVGGLEQHIKTIIAKKDIPAVLAIFKDLIIKSYGVKSPDGKRFIKSKDEVNNFLESEAYAVLFMELISDSKSAADFVNGIIPADVAAEAQKQQLASN